MVAALRQLVTHLCRRSIREPINGSRKGPGPWRRDRLLARGKQGPEGTCILNPRTARACHRSVNGMSNFFYD